jgi:hypothetical protein
VIVPFFGWTKKKLAAFVGNGLAIDVGYGIACLFMDNQETGLMDTLVGTSPQIIQ